MLCRVLGRFAEDRFAALSDRDKRDLLKLMARIAEKARAEWQAHGGGHVPAKIDEAGHRAPALRRPTAVTVAEADEFEKPVPFWADAAAD